MNILLKNCERCKMPMDPIRNNLCYFCEEQLNKEKVVKMDDKKKEIQTCFYCLAEFESDNFGVPNPYDICKSCQEKKEKDNSLQFGKCKKCKNTLTTIKNNLPFCTHCNHYCIYPKIDDNAEVLGNNIRQ